MTYNFHSIKNRNGIIGIRGNHKEATVALYYQSPYADRKANEWLQKKILKAYEEYYNKVRFNSCLRFWKENQPSITVSYTSFYGGDLLND